MDGQEGQTELKEVLACPKCHGELRDSVEYWTCADCGTSARYALGFLDFLTAASWLPMASGGGMDLRADLMLASRLVERSVGLSFAAMQRLAIELRNGGEDASETWSVRRFNERYFRVEAEIGDRAGQAILSKLDPHLIDEGRGAVRGRWALEAGGANGLFLPDFSERFSSVVLVDCSAVNLVLARRLAEDKGLKNVAFVRADVMTLPFRDGAFDFIHENNVIEHVADPEAMVREALRVTSTGGAYVCISPNRFSLAPEPHFRIAGFGFFPRLVRRPLIRWFRGTASEEGTDPRSLRQLRAYIRSAGAADVSIYFLPRRLPETALKTPLRRLVKALLGMPAVGGIVSWIVNGPMLWLMPYHIAIARRENL